MYPENKISQGAKRSRENLGDTTSAYGLEAITYRAGIRQTNETVVIEAMIESRGQHHDEEPIQD